MLLRSWSLPVRLVAMAAIGAVLAYAVIGGLLYFMQDWLIYAGGNHSGSVDTPRVIQVAAGRNLFPWDKPTPGSASPQGYVARDFARPAARGTIVFFHGNGGPAYRRNTFVNAFRKRGFRTFLYEYPGYGGRPGLPRETTVVPDARALVRELEADGGALPLPLHPGPLAASPDDRCTTPTTRSAIWSISSIPSASSAATATRSSRRR